MPRTTNNSSPTKAHARTTRAKAQAEQSVEDLKSDMADFKARLESLAAAGGVEGVVNIKEMYNTLQNRFESFLDTDFAEQLGVNAALEKGREKVSDVREQVQQNPVQSVLIAAAVGATLGFLLRR